jgi:hypothetical protein
MKLYSSVVLDDKALRSALNEGADHVLTCNIKVDDSKGLEILDANEFRVAGSHYAYQENEKLLRARLGQLWPGVLQFEGISLITAILKGMYWSNNAKGILLKALTGFDKDVSKLNTIRLHESSKFLAWLSWLKLYVSHWSEKRFKTQEISISKGCNVVFMVRNYNEFKFVQNVVNQFGRDECTVAISPGNRFLKEDIAELRKKCEVVFLQANSWNFVPFLPNVPASAEDAWLIRETVRTLPEISAAIQWSEALMKSDACVFVTIAQENTPSGHILCNYAKMYGKKVVNVMNGIKLGTANDRNAEFTKWIIWDEQMKKLLLDHSSLDPGMFSVLGNLNMDLINEHRNTGSMPLSESESDSCFVVSVISTRDLRKDKIEALNYLYQWAANKKKVVILYRPHPSEKMDQYYLPKQSTVRFYLLTQENQLAKKGLFDQLSISDVVISFGSTVAMEAAYMGIPSVTFEMKNNSLLYCVDDVNIIHARSCKQLGSILDNKITQTKNTNETSPKRNTNSVARCYADEIRKLITL